MCKLRKKLCKCVAAMPRVRHAGDWRGLASWVALVKVSALCNTAKGRRCRPGGEGCWLGRAGRLAALDLWRRLGEENE
jgi:hypothetical protein